MVREVCEERLTGDGITGLKDRRKTREEESVGPRRDGFSTQ